MEFIGDISDFITGIAIIVLFVMLIIFFRKSSRKKELLRSVSGEIECELPISEELSSNPFINNPITMEIVRCMVYHVCTAISKGPDNEENKPDWSVNCRAYLEQGRAPYYNQRIYLDSKLLFYFSDRNLERLSIDESELFFKAISLHLEYILKSSNFALNDMYSVDKISISYTEISARIYIRMNNPMYIPPKPKEKWF